MSEGERPRSFWGPVVSSGFMEPVAPSGEWKEERSRKGGWS